MKIDPEKLYPDTDPLLDELGARQTRARYRSEGRGPAYIKLGRRIFYRGDDLIAWVTANRVQPVESDVLAGDEAA